jgi:hypothetical protein
MSGTDFNALIPELSLWNHGAGVDPESWIAGSGNYPLAIGYGLVFWPRFIEFEGHILRESCFSDDNLRAWQRTGHDRRAIESVINHVHITDIHGGNPPEPNEAQFRHLGRLLREMLEAKLNRDFPDRSFEVVFNDQPGLDLDDYEVSFWQAE